MKRTAPVGAYTVDALAYPTCDGTCSCDSQGVCSGKPSGPAVQATTTGFAFPTNGPVQVFFSSGNIPDGG
jgi:hypothetical protein